MEKNQKLLIEMITRHTDYDFETAQQKLKEYDNNYIKLIKDYNGIKEKKPEFTTINQGVYKEIRKLMNEASNNFNSERKTQKTNVKSSNKLSKIDE